MFPWIWRDSSPCHSLCVHSITVSKWRLCLLFGNRDASLLTRLDLSLIRYTSRYSIIGSVRTLSVDLM